MVFDITVSNSSCANNSAWVLLEEKKNRNILFFACRHNIFEIVLKTVFITSKVSVMSGSDNPLLKRFKNRWMN